LFWANRIVANQFPNDCELRQENNSWSRQHGKDRSHNYRDVRRYSGGEHGEHRRYSGGEHGEQRRYSGSEYRYDSSYLWRSLGGQYCVAC